MRMLRSAYISRIMPDSGRRDTILAVLLWGGVTIFIFGILRRPDPLTVSPLPVAASVRGGRTACR